MPMPIKVIEYLDHEMQSNESIIARYAPYTAGELSNIMKVSPRVYEGVTKFLSKED